MTKKYEFTLSIGFAGSKHREIVELDFADDDTPADIETIIAEAYDLWCANYLDGGWSEVIE